MKETKSWNPYRSVVIYAPPPTLKENKPSLFNISNILNRIKWFYEAPVIRYYYNLVSIFSHIVTCVTSLNVVILFGV